MPYAKRRKTTSRRKKKTPYRKRSLVRYRRTPLPLNGFPSRKLVKLRYCQQISINPSVGLIGTHVFRANSLYDPDQTTTGHQPANFDKWMTWYDQYTVLGSQIKITYTPTGAGSTTPGYLGCMLTENGTEISTIGSVESLLEQSHAKHAMRTVGINTNSSPTYVVQKFSAKKFFGKTSGIIGDGAYEGTTSGSPSEGAFFEVFIASINGNDPGAINLLVQIDYIAMLSERRADELA